MITVDLAALLERVSPFCRITVEEAGSLCIEHHQGEVTVAHLLAAFLDRPGSDVRVTLAAAGLDVDAARQSLSTAFADRGGSHSQYPSFSPLLIEVLQEAWLLSSVELRLAHVRSGAIFLASLLNPARYLPLAAIRLFAEINRETLRKGFSTLLSGPAEIVGIGAEPDGSANATVHDSALVKYGHSFTDQARDGRIDPVLCRDVEIDLVVDILSRRRKTAHARCEHRWRIASTAVPGCPQLLFSRGKDRASGGGLGRRRVLGVVGQEGVVKAMNLAYSYTMRLGGERSLDAEDCSV
ncbi:Clp protease N-terminal domain-containing protein [Pseudomonas plecoglossicida]|uniref:Clp R domain-containing protein n=1 Tax=Pseudomonas plecoglossicida TaxID=70775 RepID=A0AAD0R1G8_PSEDL|nr:Clp protease N-terminal domain-containing protein [Pseudomonas plecoglossicida]AXM98857.1 hypothetical protein DVB73_25180 [Pseudomonas plecoglossicida]EPB95222.1 type VI secretion ATPase, ClpV1 family protein [Pseudomonas plecoglossicida NB2011]QLB55004.1 hypothetical protein HAV28_09180 [Pseudomonas plecoglossicida]